jgi:hypothetical protein
MPLRLVPPGPTDSSSTNPSDAAVLPPAPSTSEDPNSPAQPPAGSVSHNGSAREPRKYRSSLNDAERRRLLAALHNLHGRLGSWKGVADLVGVPMPTVYGGSRGKGTASLAILVARASGVSVEQLLNGPIMSADRCAACGQQKPM